MTKIKLRQLLFSVGILSMLGGIACAQESNSIGTITFQVGDARLERNATLIPLTKGMEIKVGDRLRTGADGHIHVRMIDSGFNSVRPSAELHI